METTYALAKAILKPWLASWFRWSIEGIENVPATGPGLLAFNHIAYLDPLAAAYTVDKAGRVPRFLAKSELFQDRKIAWVLKGAKQIEVKRGSRDAPMALDAALDALDAGELIVIFPEGTITTDPELSPMRAKSGMARLALTSGLPVVPCALWGTANIWGKGYRKRWTPRQDVLVRIGAPLYFDGSPDRREDLDRVGEEVMAAIGRLVASLRPIVPDRRRPKRQAA